MNRKKEKSTNPKFKKRFDELKEKLLRVKKLLAQEMLTNRKFKKKSKKLEKMTTKLQTNN